MNIFRLFIFSLLGCLFCITYVDKITSTFIEAHPFPVLFKYLTYLPEVIIFLAPFTLIAYVITVLIKQLNQYSATLAIYAFVGISLLISAIIKNWCKFIFGRYWPSTWINHNPSWLKNHAYGFHFFHSGRWYDSFPSGHTTIMFTAMSFAAYFFPQYRRLFFILANLVGISLIVNNFHFISDVIAGAFLGYIIAHLAIKYYEISIGEKKLKVG